MIKDAIANIARNREILHYSSFIARFWDTSPGWRLHVHVDRSTLGRLSFRIRPDLPERDFGPASMSCSEHVNSRPVPNGPFSRNYLRHGDFSAPG
jgi:hypothetical protein